MVHYWAPPRSNIPLPAFPFLLVEMRALSSHSLRLVTSFLRCLQGGRVGPGYQLSRCAGALDAECLGIRRLLISYSRVFIPTLQYSSPFFTSLAPSSTEQPRHLYTSFTMALYNCPGCQQPISETQPLDHCMNCIYMYARRPLTHS